VVFRSHDGQLLVVSSTDGYCSLITFNENELGTVYKKCEVLAPVSSPVKPVDQAVECLSEVNIATSKEQVVVQTASTEPVRPAVECLSEVKLATSKEQVIVQTASTEPVRPAVECLSEVKLATSKEEHGIVQTASITEPVHKEFSPQRTKARRVVLQTLSTNVADFTKVLNEATGEKTEMTKNFASGEPVSSDSKKYQPVITHENDVLCSGQGDSFSRKAVCELTVSCEPESMDVCGDMQDAKVCYDFCLLARAVY